MLGITLDLRDIWLVVNVSISGGLVFFLYLVMFITFWDHRGAYQAMGFTPQIVYLILIGGLVGTATNIPLFSTSRNILAINIGGALIPVFVSLYLAYNKRFNIPMFIIGTGLVATAFYFTSRLIPGIGVVSTYPALFLGPATATALALAVYGRDLKMAGPFAYSISTLGGLIGADLLRVPAIVGLRESFVGSIGGAGFRDLVFLTGLISLALILPFGRRGFWGREECLERGVEQEQKIRHLLARGHINLISWRLKASVERSLSALNVYIDEVSSIYGIKRSGGGSECDSYAGVLKRMGVPQNIIDDYVRIYLAMERGGELNLMKALFTIKMIMRYMHRYEEYVLAGIVDRIVAYIIDFILIMVITFFIVLPMVFISPNMWMYHLLFWPAVVQIFYFTLLEYLFSATVGKWVMGIRVVTLDFRPLPFMTAFARNVFRILDEMLLFYVISLGFMARDAKTRRFGDFLAGTIVVRDPRPMWEQDRAMRWYMAHQPAYYAPTSTTPYSPWGLWR